MTYTVTISGFDLNLNKLINGKIYNFRTRKYQNPAKNKGDDICCKAIRKQLKGVKIEKKVDIRYRFYEPNMRSDPDGIACAFSKCFLDSLQKCGVIENDGWKEVELPHYDLLVLDKENPRVEVEIIEK